MKEFTAAQDALEAFIGALDVPFGFWQVQSVHIDADTDDIKIAYFVNGSDAAEREGFRKVLRNGRPVVAVFNVPRKVNVEEEEDDFFDSQN